MTRNLRFLETINKLGNGTTNYVFQPTQVLGLSNGVSSVAAGGSHTLAVSTDGTLWAWGNNSDGQIGNGSFFDAITPIRSLLH